jgi:aryl-alcohol dehydrogenase-like predicted oxidoreductase/predicted HD phosphohydrolase
MPHSPAPGLTAVSLLSASELARILRAIAGRAYLTEPVDQLTHALQTAAHALAAGADDELVLAAALHDIGKAAPVQEEHPGLPHELAGAAFARQRLTERIAWLIEQHVPAKRYLVATDPAYRAQLSPASQITLARQGGPMTGEESTRFGQHLWAADAVRLRRWDDQAKDPHSSGLPLNDLLAVFARWAARNPRRPSGAGTATAQPGACPVLVIGGDLRVRRLGFGAARITGDGCWGPPPDPAAARTVLRQAIEAGVNLIDTADNYGPAISEEVIAQTLSPYPPDLVIATKGGVIRTGPNQWHHAGHPSQLRAACEASLRRLRLDAIPLYQLHRIDPAVPLADQLGTLTDLQHDGKIRHIGIDTITAGQLRQAMALAPIASVQNPYNLTHREDQDVLRACEQHGLAFLPYLPLAGGSLTNASGGQASLIDDIAAACGATAAQIAIAWLLHTSPVTVPTPGTQSPGHLAENLAAAAITLSPGQVRALDTLPA